MNINGESDSLNTQELDFKTQNIDLVITAAGVTNFLGDLKLNGVDVGGGANGNNNGNINDVNKITFDNNINAEIYNGSDITINADGGYINIKGDGLQCVRETCNDVILQPSQYMNLGESLLPSLTLESQQVQIVSSNELDIQTSVKCGNINPMNTTCDLGSDTNRFNRGYFNEIFVSNNTLFIGTEFKMYVDSGTLNIAHLDGNGVVDNVTVMGTSTSNSASAPVTKAYIDAQIALLVADITAIQTELISAIDVPQLTGPVTTINGVTYTVTHSTYLNVPMETYPGWHAFNDTKHCFTGAGMTDNENGVYGNFLKLEMSKSYAVSNYKFNSMYDNGERPTEWVLFHSMNGTTWTLADDKRGINKLVWDILGVPSSTGIIPLANPIVARYLLLIVTENVVGEAGSCVNKLVYG